MKQIKQAIHEFVSEHARNTPIKTAVHFYGQDITYEKLDVYVNLFAQYLLENGVEKGDSVALFLQNCPQYIICHLGIQKIGASVSPINPMFKEQELIYQLNDVGAEIIVTHDHLFPLVENIRANTKLKEVIVTNYQDFLPVNPQPAFPEAITPKEEIPNSTDLMEILESQLKQMPNVSIDAKEDVALILYTSGSTGMPKGAMLTYHNALWKTEAGIDMYQYNEKDIFLTVMPLTHIAGMLIGLNVPIVVGGTMVLLTRFVPDTVLDVIENNQITAAYTVVPMNVAIMHHTQAIKTDFTSLRINNCTSFGIQLTEEISNKWRALTGVPLFECAYGLTETHTADTFMSPDAIRFGSVGKPVRGGDIKIASLENIEEEAAIGEMGQILVKNDGVFKGYLNNPEATAAAMKDGYLITGDIGKFDDDGYLYFLGRTKEMIKCSGYSVFPEDVEELLGKHPGVQASAVIGVPDAVRGESVKAFVVLKPGYENSITPEEIIAWSKENMANYKYPRYIEFRTSLPVTKAGKLLRRLLAEEEQLKMK